MRAVISIGGSVLAPDLDADRVRGYADMLAEFADEGHELGVVVGGGATAREYIQTARELGANEVALDEMGIAVTRLNARLLIAALDEVAIPTPAETFEEALTAVRRQEIAVMGGTVAGHTTDAVGTALAEAINADKLVFATSVPGVYSADPDSDPTAEQFDELTPTELIEVVSKLDVTAGSNAPVDLLAAKLLQRAHVDAIVLDGTDPNRVASALRGSEVSGTTIRADRP